MRNSSKIKTTLAPLLAFLVPGSGHMLLGKPAAGLLLLLGTLTDIAAMIRLADEGGGRFALFIIFLGLGVPCFWFYSVFGGCSLHRRSAATCWTGRRRRKRTDSRSYCRGSPRSRCPAPS